MLKKCIGAFRNLLSFFKQVLQISPRIIGIIFLPVVCFAQHKKTNHFGKPENNFFQGSKWFCNYSTLRYKINIQGNKISVTGVCDSTEFQLMKGIVKNGRIYSNNPIEEEIPATKGKLYRFEDGYFGIMEPQNGDCEWFSECKK